MAAKAKRKILIALGFMLASESGGVEQALAQRAQAITYAGKLDRRNPRDGEIYASYPIQLTAGKRYEIGVDSEAFDPAMTLTDPDAEVIADDDDGGEGNNALLDFSPTRTGTYRVRVKAVDGAKPGADYKLTLREVRPLPAPIKAKPQSTTALRLETYGGTLEASDGEIRGKYEDEFIFHVNSGQTMLFFLKSDAIDPVLQIFDAQGKTTDQPITQDDDSGGGKNAFIAFTPDTEGDYIVRVTSANNGETGAYALRAAAMPES